MSSRTLPESVAERARKVKALLVDVDGVMTDGGITFNHEGKEIKTFSVQDGLGVYFARRVGLIIGIITGRSSEVVEARAKELNVDYLSMGYKNKLIPYREFRDTFKLTDGAIAFVGDDILDVPVMRECGLAVGVRNACPEVREMSHYITETTGGAGAVREVIELIIDQQEGWKTFLKEFYEDIVKAEK